MRLAGSVLVLAACGGAKGTIATDARDELDARAGIDAASAPDADAPASLDGDRDRLIRTYHARLVAMPTVVQTNGLRGADVADVCALWSALQPSARAVFLTITHRLDGAVLGDGTRALDHVSLMYRVNGGQGATAGDAGSCGGGEYNRVIVSMDATLHDALVTANGGAPAMTDIPSGGSWRASQDLGGPHAPFDLSDETNDGAPRGQVQYFRDPSSAAANAALGRDDIQTVVDPYALEIDQDYDCFHNSNPSCSYTLYGPGCAPAAPAIGSDIYATGYGDFEPAWKPSGC